jgi:hypothetical protein
MLLPAQKMIKAVAAVVCASSTFRAETRAAACLNATIAECAKWPTIVSLLVVGLCSQSQQLHAACHSASGAIGTLAHAADQYTHSGSC